MAGITVINEDLLLPFTEETPVHANFMNPIIDNVNKNTSAIGQMVNKAGDEMTGGLKLPVINIQDGYKTKSFKIAWSAKTETLEAIIDLGLGSYAGALDIILSSSYNGLDAIGCIRKIIPFVTTSGGSVVVARESININFAGNTRQVFSISDIYTENGRKKIKIIQKALGRNYATITLQMYGNSEGFEDSTITEWSESAETFIPPTMTPKETIITNGFSNGWSGEIRYGKSQEGFLIVNIIDLQKNSDINTSSIETIYPLPKDYRPSYFQRALVIGLNASAARINGSAVDIYVRSDGSLVAINCGSTTSNVRRIAGVELIAT